MRVRFWGVRGTIPTPGPNTLRYGGNTPCIDIKTIDGQLIIIDAGTGIRSLGDELIKANAGHIEATLLLSHTHWDHIQGLPFFDPLLVRGNRFRLLGPRRENISLEESVARQFLAPYLPFAYRSLAADLEVVEIDAGEIIQIDENTTLRSAQLRHPGGCFGWRIESHGTSLAYCSDTAHPREGFLEEVVELARGADLLIHDAHFPDVTVAKEYANWGHSSWEQAARVAVQADVGALVLFHYAPKMTDEALDEIAAKARTIFARTMPAREGLVLDLPLA